MIHVLLLSLCDLVIKPLLCFIKTDVVDDKNGKELCEINVHDIKNMHELTDMEIGQATQKALSTMIKKKQHNCPANGYICVQY